MKVCINIKYLRLIFLVPIITSSCSVTFEQRGNQDTQISDKQSEKIEYYEFQPYTVPIPVLNGIDLEYAYQIGSNKIVTGYYGSTDNGELSKQDSESDWGHRLFLLSDREEVLYKSVGVGDVYLFEPHFYKNGKNNKVVIICQLAFEYFFGGEVFLLENGKVQYIGNLNVESFNKANEDECLTDIVLVNEGNNQLSFKFNSDSLIINPGSIDEEINFNDDLQYVFENQEFRLKK